MLDQEQLKNLLNYDPLIGVFTWTNQSGIPNKNNQAGTIHHRGYRVIGILGKQYLAHRLAWLYVTGNWPEHGLDHKDHNKDNSLFDNLREATQKVNGKNQSKIKTNTSGFTGVSFYKKRNSWSVSIRENNLQRTLGYKDSLFEAVRLRKQAELRLNYHEHHGITIDNTFDTIIKVLYSSLFREGVIQHNQRTNSEVLAFHGYSFKWDMKYWPLLQVRKMYYKTAASEVAWMLSGSKSINWITKHTKIWDAFADEDGNKESAYGHRWSKAFGIDQVQNILTKLELDPTSRQQVLLSWDPRTDNVIRTPNIPCPLMAIFNIINGKLNCHLTLRSNDLYLGLPYDMAMYTILSNLMANSLKIEVGELFYSIAHAHIYSNQYDQVLEIMKRDTKGKNILVDISHTVAQVRADKDDFMSSINVPEYDVKVEDIFKVKVVL